MCSKSAYSARASFSRNTQKLLDDRVEFRVGRIATGDDFLVSPYNYVFIQNGFDGNPAAIFFNAPGMPPTPSPRGAVSSRDDRLSGRT
jgi:carbohydrate-selective porin OprB